MFILVSYFLFVSTLLFNSCSHYWINLNNPLTNELFLDMNFNEERNRRDINQDKVLSSPDF